MFELLHFISGCLFSFSENAILCVIDMYFIVYFVGSNYCNSLVYFYFFNRERIRPPVLDFPLLRIFHLLQLLFLIAALMMCIATME